MKLVTLNTWGGRVSKPQRDFIKKYNGLVDVFCFQEVYSNAKDKSQKTFEGANVNLLEEFKEVLKDYHALYCPVVKDYYGIATFVKKDMNLIDAGDFVIYENTNYQGGGNHDRKAHYVVVEGDSKIAIINVHGLWNGAGKNDTPERLAQSKVIKDFSQTLDIPQIICGDFNLLPDTESLKIIEGGLRNLVIENGVTSTRTSFYERSATSGTFADYIFTSPEIKVKEFRVMEEEVSDHAALYVEFEI